jgi:hypothetical protein
MARRSSIQQRIFGRASASVDPELCLSDLGDDDEHKADQRDEEEELDRNINGQHENEDDENESDDDDDDDLTRHSPERGKVRRWSKGLNRRRSTLWWTLAGTHEDDETSVHKRTVLVELMNTLGQSLSAADMQKFGSVLSDYRSKGKLRIFMNQLADLFPPNKRGCLRVLVDFIPKRGRPAFDAFCDGKTMDANHTLPPDLIAGGGLYDADDIEEEASELVTRLKPALRTVQALTAAVAARQCIYCEKPFATYRQMYAHVDSCASRPSF